MTSPSTKMQSPWRVCPGEGAQGGLQDGFRSSPDYGGAGGVAGGAGGVAGGVA